MDVKVWKDKRKGMTSVSRNVMHRKKNLHTKIDNPSAKCFFEDKMRDTMIKRHITGAKLHVFCTDT